MLNRFMRWAVPKLESWCQRRGKFLAITGKQGPDDVYLMRYFLLRTPLVSVYIHRFLRSDRDDPHDHPFDFLSYVVSGGYTEIRYRLIRYPEKGEFLMEYNGTRGPGTFAWRPATAIHKVLVDKNRKMHEIKDAPLTIIVRGPLRREWNFYRLYPLYFGPKKAKAFKKVLWFKYLNVKPEVRE